MYFKGLLKLNIKTFAALFVPVLLDLHALVYKQETLNLTLHSATPRAVLNFLFLVCKLVLVNPHNALQECCNLKYSKQNDDIKLIIVFHPMAIFLGKYGK